MKLCGSRLAGGEVMFGDGFEQSTILSTGPDGLTRVITCTSWAERESVLVETYAAELFVFRRWQEFHEKALGFRPSWGAYAVLEAPAMNREAITLSRRRAASEWASQRRATRRNPSRSSFTAGLGVIVLVWVVR